jgi:hypothetical protein
VIFCPLGPACLTTDQPLFSLKLALGVTEASNVFVDFRRRTGVPEGS